MSVGKFRNKPCICGSQKKYKVCCWGKQLNEIRYQHIHVQDNPSAMCLTCREHSQNLAVKSALPVEEITAEL